MLYRERFGLTSEQLATEDTAAISLWVAVETIRRQEERKTNR